MGKVIPLSYPSSYTLTINQAFEEPLAYGYYAIQSLGRIVQLAELLLCARQPRESFCLTAPVRCRIRHVFVRSSARRLSQ